MQWWIQIAWLKADHMCWRKVEWQYSNLWRFEYSSIHDLFPWVLLLINTLFWKKNCFHITFSIFSVSKGYCKDPGSLKNGSVLGDDYSSGSSVQFRCNVGYRLLGTQIIYCVNGTWNETIPECISKLLTVKYLLKYFTAYCSQTISKWARKFNTTVYDETPASQSRSQGSKIEASPGNEVACACASSESKCKLIEV